MFDTSYNVYFFFATTWFNVLSSTELPTPYHVVRFIFGIVMPTRIYSPRNPLSNSERKYYYGITIIYSSRTENTFYYTIHTADSYDERPILTYLRCARDIKCNHRNYSISLRWKIIIAPRYCILNASVIKATQLKIESCKRTITLPYFQLLEKFSNEMMCF